MADNTQVVAGAGDTIRDKDRSGIKTQIVLLDLNTGGSETLVSGSIPVVPLGLTTATLANVSASASNVTLQASNANRLGWLMHNDSASVLYLKFGATASATSFSVLVPSNGFYELPFRYTGIIDGIWVTATGSARVTEFTA